MELQKLHFDFTVCKIEDVSQIDFSQEFIFVSKTDDEISLVCKSSCVPAKTLAREDGWQALRISGVLDFGLVGIIAKIAELLAQAGISIFVVSTYHTDYILLKADYLERSVQILVQNGYVVV